MFFKFWEKINEPRLAGLLGSTSSFATGKFELPPIPVNVLVPFDYQRLLFAAACQGERPEVVLKYLPAKRTFFQSCFAQRIQLLGFNQPHLFRLFGRSSHFVWNGFLSSHFSRKQTSITCPSAMISRSTVRPHTLRLIFFFSGFSGSTGMAFCASFACFAGFCRHLA